MNISFYSTGNKFSPKFVRKRKEWISACIREEGFSINQISFIFCTDDFLLEMNRKFLNHDFFTDVITFSEGTGTILSGEIYISFERVLDNSKIFKVSFDEELNRIMIHGILHLMNYTDSTTREKKKMTMKENLFLQKF